jgi:hypothetical protein
MKLKKSILLYCHERGIKKGGIHIDDAIDNLDREYLIFPHYDNFYIIYPQEYETGRLYFEETSLGGSSDIVAIDEGTKVKIDEKLQMRMKKQCIL